MRNANYVNPFVTYIIAVFRAVFTHSGNMMEVTGQGKVEGAGRDGSNYFL